VGKDSTESTTLMEHMIRHLNLDMSWNLYLNLVCVLFVTN